MAEKIFYNQIEGIQVNTAADYREPSRFQYDLFRKNTLPGSKRRHICPKPFQPAAAMNEIQIETRHLACLMWAYLYTTNKNIFGMKGYESHVKELQRLKLHR